MKQDGRPEDRPLWHARPRFMRHFRPGFFPARADAGISLNVVAAEDDAAFSFSFFGFFVSRFPRRCSFTIAVSCQFSCRTKKALDGTRKRNPKRSVSGLDSNQCRRVCLRASLLPRPAFRTWLVGYARPERFMHISSQSAIMFSAALRSPGFRRRNSVRAFLMSCSAPLSAADLSATVVG